MGSRRKNLIFALSFLTFCLVNQTSAATLSESAKEKCIGIIKQMADYINTPASVQKKWEAENFSDPAKHSPKKFRYLVHGVSDNGGVDLVLHPEKVSENPFISASLVDEARGATYSTHGIVLKFAPGHILATAPTDMALLLTPQTSIEHAADHLMDFPVQSPAKILKETGKVRDPFGDEFSEFFSDDLDMAPPDPLQGEATLNYNEVLVGGHSTGLKPIEIGAFFYTVNKKGKTSVSKERMKALEAAAAKVRVPLIALPERPMEVEH